MKLMLYTPLDIHVKILLLAISCRVIFCKPFIKKDFVTAILILLKFYHSFLYLMLFKYHHSFLYKQIDIFSFLLNKVCVAASKPIKAKRNKNCFFVRFQHTFPKKSRKFLISFLHQVWQRQFKTLNKYQRKWSTVLVLRNQRKILRLTSKAPTPLLLICRQILVLIT